MEFSQISALQRSMRFIDLKALRERAGLSQREVARELGVDASTVSKWESNPTSCTADQISRYLAAIGHLDIVTQGIDIDNPYDRIERIHADLIEQLTTLPADRLQFDVFGENLRAAFNAPKLAVAGSRNAGKSTFINSLLGSSVLPAAFQPLTRTITLLRHISRRQELHKDQVCHVFNHDDDLDAVLYQKPVQPAASGGMEILDRYVAHRADGTDQLDVPCIVLVYCDAPVLLACDLIDLPGLNESPSDSEIAQRILVPGRHGNRADGVFFCSLADQFCLQPDRIVFTTWRNTSGPNRDNFWFTATRAKSLPLAMKRAIRLTLAKLPWGLDGSQGMDQSSILSNFGAPLADEEIDRHWFPFYQPAPDEFVRNDTEALTVHFQAHRRVREIIHDELPPARSIAYYKRLSSIRLDQLAYLERRIAELAKLLSSAEAAERAIADASDRERILLKATQACREYLAKGFLVEQHRAISATSQLMDAYENPAVLLKIIENNYGPDEKEEGIANAPSLISSAMQNDFGEIIRAHTESCRKELAELLANALTTSQPTEGEKVSLGSFDGNVTQALLNGGAAALLYVGGHAAVIPAIGALGAGAASWTGIAAFAAAGPIAAVAITIGAAFLLGKAIFKWFQGWRMSLAKDIAKSIVSSGVRKKILRSVTQTFEKERQDWFEAIAKVEANFKATTVELQELAKNRPDALQKLGEAKELAVKVAAMSWPPESLA